MIWDHHQKVIWDLGPEGGDPLFGPADAPPPPADGGMPPEDPMMGDMDGDGDMGPPPEVTNGTSTRRYGRYG